MTSTSALRVAELRERLGQVPGARLGVASEQARLLPAHPLIAALLPERGLRPGGVYALGPSLTLLLALLAPVSQAGSWCAVVGLPSLGAEAAASAGIALERLVLVPDAGPRWLAVTSALAEVVPLVALCPPRGARAASNADVTRLAARLRDRGATLLVQGPWPQADAMLSLDQPQWSGLGQGHGCIDSREVSIVVTSKRHPVPRSRRVLLPAAQGGIGEAPAGDALGAGEAPRLRRL